HVTHTVKWEAPKEANSPRRLERETDRRYGEGGCEGRGMDQREDDQERRVRREAAGEHRDRGRMRETVILSEAKNLGTQEGMRPFALLRVTIMITVFSLSLAGCGYEFGMTVKPGAARGLHLAVPVFHHDTFEPILDTRLTELVSRPFMRDTGTARVYRT